MWGAIGAAMAGAGSAGLESMKEQASAQLQAERDARLNDWGIKRDQRLADLQEAADKRRATLEDARETARGERDEARLKESARQADLKDARARDETARREAADERRFQLLMQRVAASGEKGGSKEDRASQTARAYLDAAKEAREQGDQVAAKRFMDQATVVLSGREPPVLPPKPAAAAPASKPAAASSSAAPESQNDKWARRASVASDKAMSRADAQKAWDEVAALVDKAPSIYAPRKGGLPPMSLDLKP